MTKKAISPLRQRMIEDMAIRKFAPKIQHDYVQRVKDFAVFLRVSWRVDIGLAGFSPCGRVRIRGGQVT